MSDHVYWLLTLAVSPGRFEDLKTLIAEMVEATQKNEPGTLNYEWAISEDRQVCDIYERYQDSAAVMTHAKAWGENFASRFMELLTPTRFLVYGAPSQEVKDALADFKPTYMAPIGGFSRWER